MPFLESHSLYKSSQGGKGVHLLNSRHSLCLPSVELNIQLRREVELAQDWYERHWKEAEDISRKILKVIERRAREYSPFEVYAKSLREFFPIRKPKTIGT